jgi:hypothetical protein
MTREVKAQEYKLRLNQLRLQCLQIDQQAQMYRIQMQNVWTGEALRANLSGASAYYAPLVGPTASITHSFIPNCRDWTLSALLVLSSRHRC